MRTLRGLSKSYLVRRHLGGLGVSLSVGKHIKWGRPTTLHNFAQIVQAYTVQAQAYLYNTYTSNLYTHIMEARLVGASYNLSYCKHTQVAQAYAVQAQPYAVQGQAHIVQTTCPKSCATQHFYLLPPVVVCSTSDSSSNGGGRGEIKSNLLQKMQSRCCHPTTGPPSSRCNTNTSSFTAAASLKI